MPHLVHVQRTIGSTSHIVLGMCQWSYGGLSFCVPVPVVWQINTSAFPPRGASGHLLETMTSWSDLLIVSPRWRYRTVVLIVSTSML